MNRDIKALADQLVATRFEQEPLEAAMLGIEEGSAGLGDSSRTAEDYFITKYRAIAVSAYALVEKLSHGGVDLGERDILTLDVVSHSAQAMADQLEVRLSDFTVSDFPNSPVAGLVSVLPQLPLDTVLRRRQYLERLSALPRVLGQVGDRHLEGIASGTTPTRHGVSSAMTFIDKVVSDPQVSGLRRDVDDGEFLSTQDRLLSDEVVPALVNYRSVLEENILAHGRDDEHPGLCWLPDGDTLYSTMVRVSTSTERTPHDLHATGLAIIERLRADYLTIGRRLWGLEDVSAIQDRLRHDPALRYDDGDEILATAVATVRRAEAAAPEWFGLVPSTECAVAPVPSALAEGSAPAYYFSGALDGSRPGTYFINTLRPQDRFRHLAEAIAFHEAVPGHHFQLTIVQEIEDNHLVHAVFTDVANAEGWGLYAERLADEMGLYSGDVALLGMLSTDAWRAARLVLDTGLHALGWSRQQAIDWMSDNVPLSPVEIVSEVDRYISMPGQALSYMVGRLEIQECRRLASEELAGRFDLRTFHDLVLSTGPVPLPALRSAVHRWIASHASA
jgi:uncharacterized protein (DUF885 family)